MSEKVYELFIFADRNDSVLAGFRGFYHVEDPEQIVICWWPDKDYYDLRGYVFSRVTVSRDIYAKWKNNRRLQDRIRETIYHAKSRLLVYPKRYMEI